VAWLFGVACALVACGSKESVSLGASVGNASLAVADQALGTQLIGNFDLFLEVGPEAEGAAMVEVPSFALVRASDQSSLVPVLIADPQGVTFPLKVGKGENKTVPFVIDDSKLLTTEDKTALCAEPVQIVGAVKHSLNGGETKPFRSNAISVTGCP
jgi:hypothetical protein